MAGYQRDSGRPVVEIWGVGFPGEPASPAEISSLADDIHAGAGGLWKATLIAGLPADWRASDGDASADPARQGAYAKFDILSPWTVGRFADGAGAQAYAEGTLAQDSALAASRGQRMLPTMFPGFSWANLMNARGDPAKAIPNQIPRRCGAFASEPARALAAGGHSGAFLAMFDEYDEGTAMAPALLDLSQFPAGAGGLGVDRDGCAMPEDGYLGLIPSLAALLAGPR